MKLPNVPLPKEIRSAKRILIERFQAVYGKGYHWSDDLYRAYAECVAEHPGMAEELKDAWVEVSEELIERGDRFSLGLIDKYEDVVWKPDEDAWFGITHGDAFERLPSWAQKFSSIEWDEGSGDYVGTGAKPPRENPQNPAVIYDAGKNEWINIFTGKVVE